MRAKALDLALFAAERLGTAALALATILALKLALVLVGPDAPPPAPTKVVAIPR
jgi:hypothetical protein